MDQLSLFEQEEVKQCEPEPKTTVRLGKKAVQIPLAKKRREAIAKLMPILKELEGKDIYIDSYDAGGRHYWLHTLKLSRLKVDLYRGSDSVPSVIVLWGSRNSSIRIFTDYLDNVREQEYMGYTQWLLDFHNGFWQSPIDNYRSHYACLTLIRFKD